nr:putative ribonuclease H-like domain-containing protein [Tanacetum cinerariifolium]
MTSLADKAILSGADNRPPMLEKDMYDSWKSIMELYMLNKQHGRMILESVENGPLLWPTVEENGVTRLKKYSELSKIEAIQADCDVKATNIILQGLLPEVYAVQERECKLYDEIDKFAYRKGESLRDFYLRFSLLLNDMNIYNMKLEQFQVNTKFLNTLPPEWSKFVTDVKLVRDLHTTNVDQLHAYLRQHEYHANEGRQNSMNAGLSRQYTSGSSGSSGKQRVIVCYNCKGEGHMSKQYTKPKRKREEAWFKDKVLLVQAQANGQVLHEEEIALMANLSQYGSDNLAEVHNQDNVTNNLIDQDMQATSTSEQSNILNQSEIRITSDSNIISYSHYMNDSQYTTVHNLSSPALQDDLILSVIEQLKTQVVSCTKINQDNKNVNDFLTAELERYKDQRNNSFSQQSAPTFYQLFEINDLKAQSQEKDTVVMKLKERLKSLSGNVKEEKIKRELEEIETIDIELDHRVTKLVAENEHLKQTYKQLYDSIKSSRVRSKEQSLKETLSKLKVKAIVNEAVTLHPIDPELLKIDVAPLAPKLHNNRTAHTDYLRHTQEETATLREIVKSDRLLNPLNTSLDYACKYTKRIQELLIILKQTYPCINDLGTKLMAVTPKNNDKKIRFTEHIPSSGNTPVKTTSFTSIVSNTPVLSSTGVNLLSSASGSQPQGNTKKDKIQITTTAIVPLRKHVPIESNASKPVVTLAEAVATACYTQNRSIIRLCHGKTPYELLHNKLPDLSFMHVFGALCYLTNDSENLEKLQPKADIGIFIVYASTKKAFWIYNRRTRRIVETIHVDFDELTVMASGQSSLGPALNEMTPATISSGLVQKYSSSTPYVPPSRNDWDLLFQSMFDELLNPSPSVDLQAPEVIAPIADVIPLVQAASTGSPSLTSVDQDAQSLIKSQTTPETQSAVIPQDVKEDNIDIEVAHIGNDLLFGIPIPEVTSTQSSSTDHLLDNIIGQLSKPVSIRLQLHEQALFCYYNAFLTSVEPKTYKDALTQSCLIEAMQEELNEFELLEVWELVPRPDKVMVITLKWIYKVKLDEIGGILKNKARLVARGYRQEEGIDFEASGF